MLGKLIKHEFKATYKSYLLLFGSLIFLTLLTKLTLRVSPEYTLYYFLSRLFLAVDVVMMVAVSFVGTYMLIMRFNRHLLKDEGYLSHTLPVRTWQHIFAKGFVGTIWILLCNVMMGVSIFIYAGNFSRIIRFIKNEIMKPLLKEDKRLLFIAILFVIILILGVIVQINSYMAALALGQIFKKHKIVGAVFFWFIINYAIGMVAGLVERRIILWSERVGHELLSTYHEVYLFLFVIMAVEILIGIAYFFIADYMLAKKLNLE